MMGSGTYERKPKNYALPPELAIDDAETRTRFGYAATSVSPGGSKKVIFRCVKCQLLTDRIRMRVVAPSTCNGCARTKQDSGPVNHLVDWDATYDVYGYRSNDLARYDPRPVMLWCTNCNDLFHVLMRTLHEGIECASCRKTQDPKTLSVLEEKETLEQFGYSAKGLSAKSFYKVVVKCATCGSLFDRIRRDVTEVSRCVPCGKLKIDYAASAAKWRATVAVNYPDGLPLPANGYGIAAQELGAWLEEKLGRKLLRKEHEKALSDTKRIDI